MILHLKFKILSIHPRSRIIRPFMSKDHCVHVLLDNGAEVYGSVPDPKYLSKEQYIQFVVEAVQKELIHHSWLGRRPVKSRCETLDQYLTTVETMGKSYEFSGVEGETEVSL